MGKSFVFSLFPFLVTGNRETVKQRYLFCHDMVVEILFRRTVKLSNQLSSFSSSSNNHSKMNFYLRYKLYVICMIASTLWAIVSKNYLTNSYLNR